MLSIPEVAYDQVWYERPPFYIFYFLISKFAHHLIIEDGIFYLLGIVCLAMSIVNKIYNA